MVAKGEGRAERDGLGVWDEQMRTIIYRMNKQPDPTVRHRELYSISCEKPYGKEYEKEHIYMYNCITLL